MALSEQQLRIVNSRGKNLLVSAGAGSGKTTVLIERIINLIIKDGYNVDDLLVVTFTEAAASDMRAKLGNAIADALNTHPNNSHLLGQLKRLNKANISTIDSFCQSVVKRYIHKTQLDPSYRIGDKGELNVIRDKALNEVLEAAYAEGKPELLMLDRCINLNQDDETLTNMIWNLYEFTSSLPSPTQWFKSAKDFYKDIDSVKAIKSTVWYKALEGGYKQLLNDTHGISEMLLDYIAENEIEDASDKPDDKKPYLRAVKSDIECMDKAVTEGEISSFEFKRFAKDVSLPKEAIEYIKAVRTDYKEKITKFAEDLCLFDEDNLSLIKLQGKLLGVLIDLTQSFILCYDALKREALTADFNDLERNCHNILHNEDGSVSEVAREYQKQFKEIIIDEYQDTNSLQDSIFEAISNGHNRFMVGDVKQSIYGFRRAEPQLFIDKFNEYSSGRADSELILLKDNYRSRPAVLESCNLLFYQIMRSEIGSIDYTEDVALNPKASYSEDTEGAYKTEVHILLKDKGSNNPLEDNATDLIDELADAEKEGIIIAKSIRELIDSQLPVFDKSVCVYRPVRYGDITILLRAVKVNAPAISAQLTRHNIPSITSSGSMLVDTLEFQTVKALVAVVDNPLRDIELVSVMHSPMYDFTIDELAKIRHGSRQTSFYDSLLAYKNRRTADKALSDKIEHLIAKLDEYIELSHRINAAELLGYMLDDTDYSNLVHTMQCSEERDANLTLIMELATAFDINNGSGIGGFYEQLVKMTESPDQKSASTTTTAEDVVKITTIHSSKGLEYPVVYIACLNKRFNLMDVNSALKRHKDYGASISLKPPKSYFSEDNSAVSSTIPVEDKRTVAEIGLKYIGKLETQAEEMRLLYVAMTRARDKLIMVGTTTEDKYNKADYAATSSRLSFSHIYHSMSYLDWIMPAIHRLGSYDGGKYARYITTKVYTPGSLITEDGSALSSRELPPAEATPYINQVSKQLNYKYPFGYITTLPSTLSISEIKRLQNKGEDKEYNSHYDYVHFEKPNFMIKNASDISSARMGTVYHAVFEKLDFAWNSLDEVKALVEYMVDRGVITRLEAERLDCNKVVSFLNSDLGERLRRCKRSYREMPFVMNLPAVDIYGESYSDKPDAKVIVHGIIDLYFYEGDDIVLVDYKTDRIRRDVSELREKYAVQLRMYKRAIELNTGKRVKQTIYYSVYKNEMLVIE